jgi:UDP-glucose 4-epimerase
MKNRILITGGMGFVGGRVAQSLAKRDDALIILGSRTLNASSHWLPSAEVVTMDWRCPKNLALICDRIDTIVHTAGLNDAECMKDPVAALEVNAVNTARLMEAAKLAGVKRVIYISTIHVYGHNLIGQIDESALTQSRHPYATSHRAAEDVVLSFSNFNLEGIILRLSNGFGVPAHPAVNVWTLLINELCRQAVTLRSMTLHSAGLQYRDFITLEDVSRVVIHMIGLPKSKISGGIFNVGSGKSTQIIAMAKLIQIRCTELLGYTPKIHHPPPDIDDKIFNFDYKIDKLIETGFYLTGNQELEIDNILQMCNDFFLNAS